MTTSPVDLCEPCTDPDDLCDFCARCVAGGCNRADVITSPAVISWCGPGTPLIATYECADGHEWNCTWAAKFYREEMEG